MIKTFHVISSCFVIVAIILLTTNLQAQSKKNKQKKLPNVIYIYADDLGIGELGSYGQQKIKTPNLDKMAGEGMRFTQHYTSMPVCAPARAMLMTGKHAGKAYIRGNHELGGFPDSTERGQLPLKDEEFTVAELMKQKGYVTALTGKWGLGMHNTEGSPNSQGFDYFYGYLDQKQAHNYYPTHLWENDKWDSLHQPFINVHKKVDPATFKEKDYEYYTGKNYAPEKITEKALGFINNNKDKPFFLYLPYTIPHVSLQVPEAYVKQYIGQFDEKPYYAQQGYTPVKYPLSTYAAMITYLDEQVGIIMQRIKDLGLDDHTLIMFSSDNGPSFNGGVDTKFFNSTMGLRGMKMDVYEGGIRMPFIARWPGKIKPGTVSDLVSIQYDFMATLAEITNQQAPANDGVSYLPTLLGKNKEQQKREFIYFEYPEKGGQVAIRMGNWKGVRTNVRKNKNAPWQLYDLTTDVSETKDIAANHPEIIERFKAIQEKEHHTPVLKEWEFLK